MNGFILMVQKHQRKIILIDMRNLYQYVDQLLHYMMNTITFQRQSQTYRWLQDNLSNLLRMMIPTLHMLHKKRDNKFSKKLKLQNNLLNWHTTICQKLRKHRNLAPQLHRSMAELRIWKWYTFKFYFRNANQ